MHEMELSDNLLAVARAGAGVNNIPLDKCAEKGIVVFNTPGANANGVKELVIAGMLLASRDVIGGVEIQPLRHRIKCLQRIQRDTPRLLNLLKAELRAEYALKHPVKEQQKQRSRTYDLER